MVKIKCHKCNHIWETKSESLWVTCPSCQYKTKNGESKMGNEVKT